MKQKKTWYSLRGAPEGQVSEVEIFDEIGYWGITADQFRKDFKSVAEANQNRIKLLINSPGGSVFDGMTIYNTVAEYKGRVDVEVVGLAASMASIIALAGNRVTMNPGSFLMIHNPWSLAIGDAEAFRKEAGVLDKIRDQMALIYSSKSGLTHDEVSELMDAETWLTGAEAVEKGFADESRSEGKAAAMAFRLGKFKNVPQGLEVEEPTETEESPSGELEKNREEVPEEKGGSEMGTENTASQAQVAASPEIDYDKLTDMISAKMAPAFAGLNRQIKDEEPQAKAEKEELEHFVATLKRDQKKGASLTTSDISVPTTVAARIFERAAEMSIPRKMGVVFENYAPTAKIPILPAPTAMAIVAEGGNFPDAQTAPTAVTLEPRRLLGKFSATDLAIQGGLNILGMFERDSARAIAAAENNLFVNGNPGATPAQPQGITIGGAVGKTTASATAITVAEVMDFIFSIDQAYMDGAFLIMNPAVYKYIINLKDGANQFVFMPDRLYDKAPLSILGRPVLLTSYAESAITTGKKTALLAHPSCMAAGSFGGLQVRTQQNQNNGNIEYLVTHYFDHKVVDQGGAKWLAQA